MLRLSASCSLGCWPWFPLSPRPISSAGDRFPWCISYPPNPLLQRLRDAQSSGCAGDCPLLGQTVTPRDARSRAHMRVRAERVRRPRLAVVETRPVALSAVGGVPGERRRPHSPGTRRGTHPEGVHRLDPHPRFHTPVALGLMSSTGDCPTLIAMMVLPWCHELGCRRQGAWLRERRFRGLDEMRQALMGLENVTTGGQVETDSAVQRKCLVTGGASGLGFAIAIALRRQGGRVAIGDVSAASLTRAAAAEPLLLPLELDVRRKSSVDSAVEQCVSALGGLDTVIHAAGIIHVKPLVEVLEDDWQATLDVNLSGAFRVVQAAAEYLRASKNGRVVFITSGAGARGYPWLQAYCASKFGLGGLAQSLAAELAPDGVTVNCIAPGACPFTGMGRMLTAWKAAMTDSSEDEVLRAVAAHSPLGLYAEEAEIAAAAVFLTTEAAGYMTGATLDLTGGEQLGFISGASSRSGSGFTSTTPLEASDA